MKFYKQFYSKFYALNVTMEQKKSRWVFNIVIKNNKVMKSFDYLGGCLNLHNIWVVFFFFMSFFFPSLLTIHEGRYGCHQSNTKMSALLKEFKATVALA